MSNADTTGADVARNPVPISPERHGERFWRRFDSWDFAGAQRLVPIVLGEHEQVAASLPIFFVKTGAGVWPVALSRLTADGPCALVSPSGAWRGSYIPSVLRVHPFTAQRTRDNNLALLVDEASGLVTDDPGDEPFFTDDGAPAPGLDQVIGFFQERSAAELRTRDAMAEVTARGLLVPFSPPSGLEQIDSEGLLVPDRARIDGLRRTDLAALHRCGALALLQAQAVSLHHLPLLAAAEAQPERHTSAPATPHLPTAAPVAPGVAQEAALSGFLDALADSHERDTDGPAILGEQKSDPDGPPDTSQG